MTAWENSFARRSVATLEESATEGRTGRAGSMSEAAILTECDGETARSSRIAGSSNRPVADGADWLSMQTESRETINARRMGAARGRGRGGRRWKESPTSMSRGRSSEAACMAAGEDRPRETAGPSSATDFGEAARSSSGTDFAEATGLSAVFGFLAGTGLSARADLAGLAAGRGFAEPSGTDLSAGDG
jgi:hypothetical protein